MAIACCAYDMTRVPDQKAKKVWLGGGAINRAASPAASLSPRHLANKKMAKIWHFRELFNFYPILGY